MAERADYSDQTVWLIAIRDRRDRAAFGRLFDHYAPRLRGMILRSGFKSEYADDIVQDVMLTVWRKSAQFDPERAQASAWIYRIARNRQVDLSRRESRPLPEDLWQPEPGAEDAGQIIGLEQEAAQLRDSLARLTPEQREVVEKSYLGDLSHSEIQGLTGLPLGTIKSRIRLGLERLRHELKDLRE